MVFWVILSSFWVSLSKSDFLDDYLVIVTEKELAATIQQHKIWRVKKVECLGVGNYLNMELTPKQLDSDTFAKVNPSGLIL
jgi:hypothetical protein